MIHIPEAVKRFWAPGSQGTQTEHRDWGQLPAETGLGIIMDLDVDAARLLWTQKQKGRRQFPPAKLELIILKNAVIGARKDGNFFVFLTDYPRKVLQQENERIFHLQTDVGPACTGAGRVPLGNVELKIN